MGAGVRLGGWNIDGYTYGQGNYVRNIRRVPDGSETLRKFREGFLGYHYYFVYNSVNLPSATVLSPLNWRNDACVRDEVE